MRPVIGFAGNGHLMQYSKAAAHAKDLKVVGYTPVKTGDHPSDLKECDIVYICPDRPSNTSPQEMVDLVLPHLDENAALVVLCQVEPGFTRKIKWPNVYYQVETLKVNDEAMDRALNPERIIIGCDWDKNWDDLRLIEFVTSFTNNILWMSYEEAELAKIAINVYLAAQVCATNTLAGVAKKIGANWENIIPALQSDKRIGYDAYLKPGNGCGPHLERDLRVINQYPDIDSSVTQAFLKYSEILGNTAK